MRKWSLARTKAMSVRPTDVGLGRFRKGGGQRGRGVEGGGSGGGPKGGGSKEEPGSKRVKEGGPEGGECQKEERKRFEKKDDFNEKPISKRVY